MTKPLTLSKVDEQDPLPKYVQTRDILVAAIRSGRLSPGSKLPSTKEISALVDVSLITAHKALEELVEMGLLRREVGRGTFVRDDIDFTGKQPRELSLGLLLQQSGHINVDDYYHSTLINALRREARGDSQRVEFFFHEGFDLRDKRRKDVGAICLHPPIDTMAEVERLAQRVPTVVLGGSYNGTQVNCVDCDNVAGARDAIRHLLSLGHERFMVLSGPINLSNSRDRADGAMRELAEAGLHVSERDLPVSKDSVVLDELTRSRIEKRLHDKDRPTAIFAGGFYLAMAVSQVVRKLGLSIPEDVSVVGFDDPMSASLLDPPLTTIRQPLDEMAAQAFACVREGLLGRENKPQTYKLAPELVVRSSTGPVG